MRDIVLIGAGHAHIQLLRRFGPPRDARRRRGRRRGTPPRTRPSPGARPRPVRGAALRPRRRAKRAPPGLPGPGARAHRRHLRRPTDRRHRDGRGRGRPTSGHARRRDRARHRGRALGDAGRAAAGPVALRPASRPEGLRRGRHRPARARPRRRLRRGGLRALHAEALAKIRGLSGARRSGSRQEPQAAATGRPLRAFEPQSEALYILGTADGSPIATRNGRTMSGPLVWQLKLWLDGRHIARYRVAGGSTTAAWPRDSIR
jgi:hypothetical protein